MGATKESTLSVQRSIIVICFVFILVAVCPAQTKSRLREHTFRNENVGLTWTFPETLVPEAPDRLPRDRASRERIIFALWDEAQKTPVPLIAFLWDTRSRPDTRSPSAWALQYLADLKHRQSLSPGESVKMSDPTETKIGGRTAWKMNYSRPDQPLQPFMSAITVATKGRTVLFIQMSARSKSELDSFINSLAGAMFDPEE
jgi:hypothetical protein